MKLLGGSLAVLNASQSSVIDLLNCFLLVLSLVLAVVGQLVKLNQFPALAMLELSEVQISCVLDGCIIFELLQSLGDLLGLLLLLRENLAEFFCVFLEACLLGLSAPFSEFGLKSLILCLDLFLLLLSMLGNFLQFEGALSNSLLVFVGLFLLLLILLLLLALLLLVLFILLFFLFALLPLLFDLLLLLCLLSFTLLPGGLLLFLLLHIVHLLLGLDLGAFLGLFRKLGLCHCLLKLHLFTLGLLLSLKFGLLFGLSFLDLFKFCSFALFFSLKGLPLHLLFHFLLEEFFFLLFLCFLDGLGLDLKLDFGFLSIFLLLFQFLFRFLLSYLFLLF